jgi:transposase InsO family protein
MSTAAQHPLQPCDESSAGTFPTPKPGNLTPDPGWDVYVDMASGFVYTAFVTDLFSRRIADWQVGDMLRAELALDVLEMAIWSSGG